jgi:hypothetical protein
VDLKRSPRANRGPSPPPLALAGKAAARAAAAAAVQGQATGPGSAQAQGQAKMAGVGEALDLLAADVRQLRVDFERFFSGALPLPPEELRHRIQVQLRQLRNLSAMTAVDRFRLGDLEARHISYNELFSRRLREREEGRPRGGHAVPAPAQAAAEAAPGAAEAAPAAALGPAAFRAAAPPPASPRYDPRAGVILGRSPDPEAVAALFQGLTAAGQGGTAAGAGAAVAAGPRFDLASFGSYLQRQAAAIRDKTGCDDVQFRLAAEDGKLKLKARPVGGAGQPPRE